MSALLSTWIQAGWKSCTGNIPSHRDQEVQNNIFGQLGHVNCFFKILLVHFQPKCANVNAVSYCEMLGKLHSAICQKYQGLLTHSILLYHNKARLHTLWLITAETELWWDVLEHPFYSPDLASSNFHLFGPLKTHLASQYFSSNG